MPHRLQAERVWLRPRHSVALKEEIELRQISSYVWHSSHGVKVMNACVIGYKDAPRAEVEVDEKVASCSLNVTTGESDRKTSSLGKTSCREFVIGILEPFLP